MSDIPSLLLAASHRTCPACHASMPCYDAAHSTHFACPNCWTYFHTPPAGQAMTLRKYNKLPAAVGLLPVGTAGTLDGLPCRITGFIERIELGPEYAWAEYQVYFPDSQCYVQLALYRGHWLLVRPANQTYTVQQAGTRIATVATTDGTFKIFNSYRGRIRFAEGEFDWDIEDDEDVQVREYICPPLQLVEETGGGATAWYVNEHLEPAEVAAAFGLDAQALPERIGVGAAQPSPTAATTAARRQLTWLMVTVLLLVQVGFWSVRTSTQVYRQTLTIAPDPTAAPGTGRVLVGESFELTHPAAVELFLTASVDNQWLELTVSLVNEQTGRGYEFTKNIEYYRGVERGHYWHEGSVEGEAVLNEVPAGRYHLNFYPFFDAPKPGVPPVPNLRLDVAVTENPYLWSNLWVVLALTLAYSMWQGWRDISWEEKRWSLSDYKPQPPKK